MDFKTLVKKISRKKQEYKKPISLIDPTLYWKSILILSASLIIGFFGFGYYLVVSVEETPATSPLNNPVQVRSFNKTKLDQAIEYFSKREKVSQDILSSPSLVVDPSL